MKKKETRDYRIYSYTNEKGMRFISKKVKKEGSVSTVIHNMILKAMEDAKNEKTK